MRDSVCPKCRAPVTETYGDAYMETCEGCKLVLHTSGCEWPADYKLALNSADAITGARRALAAIDERIRYHTPMLGDSPNAMDEEKVMHLCHARLALVRSMREETP